MTFQFGKIIVWTGNEGFQVYSEVHQTLGNVIIHTLGLPIITFSVLRLIYVLCRSKNLARFVVFLLLLFYSNFYLQMSFLDMAVWTFVITPTLMLADSNKWTPQRVLICLLAPLLIQETIGHALFEGANSRLTISHVTNAILYTPMFYTRGLWRFCAALLGYSWFHTYFVAWLFGAVLLINLASLLSFQILAHVS